MLEHLLSEYPVFSKDTDEPGPVVTVAKNPVDAHQQTGRDDLVYHKVAKMDDSVGYVAVGQTDHLIQLMRGYAAFGLLD